jgi:hypothetical protein
MPGCHGSQWPIGNSYSSNGGQVSHTVFLGGIINNIVVAIMRAECKVSALLLVSPEAEARRRKEEELAWYMLACAFAAGVGDVVFALSDLKRHSRTCLHMGSSAPLILSEKGYSMS